LNSASFELGTTLDCNFGLGEENRRKKWFLQTRRNSVPQFVSSREVVLLSRKEERHTSTPRVFCTNWSHRMSRTQSRASAWDQVTRKKLRLLLPSTWCSLVCVLLQI
jgi:hypothetical protein